MLVYLDIIIHIIFHIILYTYTIESEVFVISVHLNMPAMVFVVMS